LRRLCFDKPQCLRRIENVDVAPGMQDSQVFIAGDDETRLGAERARQHRVIVGVATNLLGQLPGGNELREAAIVGDELLGAESGARHMMCVLLAMQDVVDLGDQVGAGEAIDLPAIGEIEETRTDAGPQKAGHHDIAVENYLQCGP